jgi:molecular chaperone DnaJ
VAPHPTFGRDGGDLTVTVPVTFPEAALGADVRVPTLDRPVVVRIPPGTRSGTVLRVPGRGVPADDGAGDLLVTVEVEVPRQLDERQRAAVQALAAATSRSPRAHLGV